MKSRPQLHKTSISRSLCLPVILGCLLSACYRDSESTVIVTKPDDPEVTISTDIAIALSDEQGSVPTDIRLTYDGVTKMIAGQLTHFRGTDVNKHHEVLTVIDPVHGTTLFHLHTRENDVSYPEIGIVRTRGQATLQPSVSSEFSMEELQVLFEPNTFLLNGQTYNSEVALSGFSKAIETADDIRFFPGSRVGYNEDAVPGFLNPHRLFLLNARSSIGETLTFAEDRAWVDVLSDCSTCAVWKMDEEGFWHSVSDSEFVPNSFRFHPVESGYYCIAEWQPRVIVSGSIVSGTMGLPGIELHFYHAGTILNSTRTTNSGKWEAQLPANTPVDIEIHALCGQVSDAQYETIRESTTMPAIDLASKVMVSQIHGTARDCNDDILSNHFIQLSSAGKTIALFLTSGEFVSAFIACNEEMSVRSITSDWSASGPTVTWDATPQIQLYSTYACENAQNEYVVIRIQNDKKIYWITESTLTTGDRTQLIAEDPANPGPECTLWISGIDEGEIADMALNILFEDTTLSNVGYSLYCPTSTIGCGFEKFKVTHFGETGEWIRGYFEGTFWVKTLNPLTAGNKRIVGEFQVYRDF